MLGAFSTSGQYTLADADHLILKNPESSEVILRVDQSYAIQLSNGSLNINSKTTEERLIAKTGMFHAQAEELWSDSGLFELKEFNAYSLVPGNGKYRKNEVKDYFNKDEMSSNRFNSDSKAKGFYFPNLLPRSITHLDYEVEIKSPYFLRPYFIQDFFPIEEAELRIEVDNDVQVEFQYFHLDPDTVDYQAVRKKHTTEHIWKFRNVPSLEYFSDAPNIKWYLPHIVFKVAGYMQNDRFTPNLSEIGNLYALYSTWLDQIEPEQPEKVAEMASIITADLDSEEKKLEAIYHWVQDNVKYVSFTEGMEGWVPRSATDVLDSRFGDCKGMTNLMYNLAAASGVKTYRTWIGTRDIPYTYESLGTPLVDNHMILTYLKGDSTVFLDATSPTTPFGFPTEGIQDKEAMMDLGNGSFKLVRVPVVERTQNTWTDTLWAHIDGDDLIGHAITHLSGYETSRLLAYQRNRDQDEIDELYKHLVLKGDNRFTMQNIRYESSLDNKSMTVEYDFSIPDYLIEIDDELYVNINLEQGFASDPIEKDRLIPVEMDYAFTTNHVVILQIPDSLQVKSVPENSEVLSSDFGYSLKYDQSESTITSTLTAYSTQLIVYPESFEQWNSLSSRFRKDIRKSLLITSKK